MDVRLYWKERHISGKVAARAVSRVQLESGRSGGGEIDKYVRPIIARAFARVRRTHVGGLTLALRAFANYLRPGLGRLNLRRIRS
jgi:hypothetical protein